MSMTEMTTSTIVLESEPTTEGRATFVVAPVELTQTMTPTLGAVVAPSLDLLEQQALEAAVDVLGDQALDQVDGFRLPANFKLTILMPVYNEKRTIQEIIARVRALPLPKEVIVVDDGSTDGTRELLKGIRSDRELKVVFHSHNQGKGAAIRTALRHARGDVVVIQDADLEYDPREFLRLIRPIVENQADVVYGSRFFHGKPAKQTFKHWLANRLLTALSNLATDLRLTDMETCQKVFRRSALYDIDIKQNRFGVEPELTAKVARRGHRFVELPIAYDSRDISEGKKIGLKDAFNALWCIVRYSIAD
ncbi:MAG: glycosyltransferase family 2 protein [Planctomycetaceae bacterium]|nr:glycosyltransferase family 2 protein [Planctomycetaceae bacterium]